MARLHVDRYGCQRTSTRSCAVEYWNETDGAASAAGVGLTFRCITCGHGAETAAIRKRIFWCCAHGVTDKFTPADPTAALPAEAIDRRLRSCAFLFSFANDNDTVREACAGGRAISGRELGSGSVRTAR